MQLHHLAVHRIYGSDDQAGAAGIDSPQGRLLIAEGEESLQQCQRMCQRR